jgi:hypothetical protein
MGLLDITPIGQTDDYSFGYCAGQRYAHANAYLRGDALTRVAHRLWLRVSHTVNLTWMEYVRGFRQGYTDELNGTAHPLPRTDQPYKPHELEF